MIRIPITSSSSSTSSSSARGVLKSTKSRSAQRKTTTFTISNRVSAPPNPKIGSDVDVRVFCPSKVSRICRKKRRRREGPGGPEDEEPPLSSSPGDYEMFEDDEEDEGELDDGGDDDGFDDISNDGGDGGGGDDENDDDDDDDDDEFDEKWENIIKRLEDNYQNLEAVKTVSDPYAGLNGVSGELSMIWSAGCVVTYASAIAHSLDTMISPLIKGESDGYVDVA
jgi:hypothetical protein